MSLNLKNKRSAVAGSTPTPAQLEEGEIGVNYNSTDPALYIKDSTGTVVRIAGDGAAGTGGQWTRTGTNLYPQNIGDSVGINTATPGQLLTVNGGFGINNGGGSGGSEIFSVTNASGSPLINATSNATALTFGYNGTEAARLDSSGRLLVGTSTARSLGGAARLFQVEGTSATSTGIATIRNSPGSGGPTIILGKTRGNSNGSNTIVLQDDQFGSIQFAGADGNDLDQTGASITAFVDGTPGADIMPGRLVFSTTASGSSTPTERMRLTSDGNVGIGVASPTQKLDVNGNISLADGSTIQTASSTHAITVQGGAGVPGGSIRFGGGTGDNDLRFSVAASEAARIDSSGRLLVGTSIEYGNAEHVVRGNAGSATGAGVLDIGLGTTRPGSAGTALGYLRFTSTSNTASNYHYAAIYAETDGTSSSDTDIPGRLAFSTTASGASSPTERYQIDSSGTLYSANNDVRLGTQANVMSGGGRFTAHGDFYGGIPGAAFSTTNDTNGAIYIQFGDSAGTKIGSITRASSTSVAYNTTSDYRLKENVLPLQSTAQLVKQLNPVSYNFIGHSEEQITGFVAHELQEFIPEAVTGEKDATYEDGSPNYQGVDLSKLVPLLTAALQEALAKIETLEQRLTDAGIA